MINVLDVWNRAAGFARATPKTVCKFHEFSFEPELVYEWQVEVHMRNGFGGKEPEIAASLPYTSGSMVAVLALLDAGATRVGMRPLVQRMALWGLLWGLSSP